MAKFDIAFDITMKYEGAYSIDPQDLGGETYKGITRRYEPNWSGWKIIEQSKSHPEFPAILNKNTELQNLVRTCYKNTYWDKFSGDEIPNQEVANELFDTGVNMGVNRAVMFLQKSLNALNRNGKIFPDLVEDGVIGKKSIFGLSLIIQNGREEVQVLLKMMNVFQGMHYIEFMRKSPEQEKFARGWFNRVSLGKGET